MTTLYIIGNGFDLWHKLPTKFANFYESSKDALDAVVAYYSIGSTSDQPWHDFENFLGKYAWRKFYNSHNFTDVTSESFRPRDAYCLEDELMGGANDLVESIEGLFHEWIASIDTTGVGRMLELDPDSLFLTFNYTSTLQRAYGVSAQNVLHIHGSAEAYDKLVFGHGEVVDEEPERDEEGNSNRTMFTDSENAAKYPFYALRKPVVDIIERNVDFFLSLNAVTRVVVMGHSLSEIDLPYFQEVAKNAVGCKWLVYCHEMQDKEHYTSQLHRCGVGPCNIEVCSYESPWP